MLRFSLGEPRYERDAMSYRDPATGPPTGILPYLAAFVLLVLILVIAWYLFGRNQHSISVGVSLVPRPVR
jgi:hypothetical protein